MIGRTNSGTSGGGLSPNSAVIHVTAPVGSTISFSKGGVIVKTLGPEKSHVNAENNTLAEWYYAVSSSNYGSWTIAVSLNGSVVATSTVAISENKDYQVYLADLVLYDATNGYHASYEHDFLKTPSGCTATDSTGYIYLKTVANNANDLYARWKNVDLTTFSLLKCEIWTRCTGQTGASRGTAFVTQSSSIVKYASASIKNRVEGTQSSSVYSKKVVSVDISGCSGTGWFVAVGTDTDSWTAAREAQITSVILKV